MTNKHTPGPWRITNEGYRPNGDYAHQIGTSDVTIAYTWCPCGTSAPPGELGANATLIAAAPDLLSTLDAMVTLHDSGEQISASWWGAARYAIAKARGDR